MSEFPLSAYGAAEFSAGVYLPDVVEAVGQDLPRAHMPVRHTFTPGLYIREFRAPAGALIATRIHKFEHPFILSQGVCDIVDEMGDSITLIAPYLGVTMPGARRTILVKEDIIWTTFHVTDLTDPDEIVKAVTEDYTNPILGETHDALMAKQYAQLPD